MEGLSLVGGSFLSATFDFLFEKLNGYLSDQLRDSKEKVRAQMESWKTFLPKIRAILQHTEENKVANLFVKSCLDDLRDLAYDMEDILEEFVIDAKRSELIAKSYARPNKRQKFTSSVMSFFRPKANPNREIDSVVNHLNVRLQHIEKEMHTFGLINLIMKEEDKSHRVVAKRLPESSLLECKVLGRDSEKDAILQRLLEEGGSLEQDFVIPIVGMGGLGKTTLARLIYNDEKLEGMFDMKAWVCVADVFDVPKITRTILEHVTGEKCDFDFGLLQEILKGKLSGRKFFLVLDDVWNKEYDQWDVLKRPFMSGASGSKIIVTTRNKEVGTMMRGDDGVYNLELLQDDACLPLFTRHALGKENFEAHRDLQDVGEKLVKRCKRLPLALKTLGGVLRGKLHCNEWENILNSEIWSLSEDRSGILPALRLSYNHLSSHLKRCFAYCALFPKDYEFDKKELILLWMAEGLLQQQSHEKKQMEEDTGHEYFQELLSRSVFQPSSIFESRFVMHDLINDLAVVVAGEIYCNLEQSMGDKKLKKARHLSFTPHCFEISKRFRVLNEFKHLRTFLPLKGGPNGLRFFSLSNGVLHDFLPTLNCLRVLSLSDYRIRKLPNSFENLKHIRYIDLSNATFECLPESLGSLLFLQTLLLSGCGKLAKLPTTIGNLIDLHYLDITETYALKEMPSGIGNLKNLVTLSKFMVGKAREMLRLSDLKNLLQLRGELSILDLQNVLDVQEAREANLDRIHGLKKLVLQWTALDNYRDESVLEIQVLSWLKPHLNLETLKIFCYGGENFPNWICDPSLFLNLSSMELSSCKRCTSLPLLGQLPVLKKLSIRGMEATKAVGLEFYGQHDSFPLLEVLEFQNMLNWKEWTSMGGSECEFPCLHRLVIQNCPKLLGPLPSNLSSLKELHVSGCNAMTCLPMSMSLPSLKELYIQGRNGVLLKNMVDLNSLTKLTTKDIVEPTCLPMSMSLQSLKELYIQNCNGVLLKCMANLTSVADLRIEKISELTCLPETFKQSLIALESLYIKGCTDLTCLWEEGAETKQSLLPSNLKHLTLCECGALESLPDAMMVQMDGSSSSNTSMLIEKLTIDRCDSLKSFPRGKLPTTLKYLSIVDCKGLESLPDANGDDTGNLYLEIKNLPRLYSSQGSCHQLPTFLKKFTIDEGGGRLESFPERMLQHCTGLQSISIWWCTILKSLPTLDCVNNLVELIIFGCKVLESLPDELGSLTPNLRDLIINECDNFKFLPNTMHLLKSLRRLNVQCCLRIESIPDGGLPSLPPILTVLRLDRCVKLKRVPNILYQLTSLQTLRIPGRVLTMEIQNLVSLQRLGIDKEIPQDIVLPSSLIWLGIWSEENLESIPRGLFQNLSSLERLWIGDWPKLRSLLAEALPPSLGSLTIWKCPLLKEDYSTFSRDIPSVTISKSQLYVPF